MSNKCIYQPTGAAKEYGTWVCNLYNGCRHQCNYCYCRRGAWKDVLGVDEPVLKKQVGRNEEEAYLTFMRELRQHRDEILQAGDGLFFSFSTDPMQREEIALTMRCVRECVAQQVPVQILTKATWWTRVGNTMEGDYLLQLADWRKFITVGVTLTGHDELEPGAPSSRDRIVMLERLLQCGIRTFVSLEPVVDLESSLAMFLDTLPFTSEYRIGLMSPYKKDRYDHEQCERFAQKISEISHEYGIKVKWKESIRRFYDDGLPLLKLMEKGQEA